MKPHALGRSVKITLAGCLLLASACHKKEEAEVEAPAPVQVTAVTQDTVRRIVAGDGALFPREQETVMPKISAPVQKFYANRGDHVKVGQLLATLENRDLKAAAAANQAQVAQAEANYRSTAGAAVPEAAVKAKADVEAAQQQLDAAQKLLESRKQLLAQGALARRQVDEAQVQYAQAKSQLDAAREHLRAFDTVGKQAQIATAQAQIEAAKAQAQSAEAQVAYSEIRSPIAGVVADRPLYPGDLASAGNPLFTIVDISRVVARVNIPLGQANLVKVGQPAEITLPDSEESFTGKVTVISPATDPNTTTMQVWVEIPNPGEALKPGTSVHCKIVAEAFKAAAVVPASAILPGEEGGTAVLVVTPDGIAHRRPVQLGVREGNKIQVLNGVRPGEEVVVVGGLGLDDKAKVKVIDPNAKEADEDENPEPDAKGPDQKKDEAKPKAK